MRNRIEDLSTLNLRGEPEEGFISFDYSEYKEQNYGKLKKVIEGFRQIPDNIKPPNKDILRRFQASLRLLERGNEIGYPSPCMAATVGFTHPELTEKFDFSIPSTFLLDVIIAKNVANSTGQVATCDFFIDESDLTSDIVEESLSNCKSAWFTIIRKETDFSHVMGFVAIKDDKFVVWDTSFEYKPFTKITCKDVYEKMNQRMKIEKKQEASSIISFR